MDNKDKYSLACDYSNEGRYNEAIQIFKGLFNDKLTKKKKADLFFRLGCCYYFLDEYELSLVNYKESQKYDPGYEATSLGIHLSLADLDRGEEAIEELNNFASKYEINLYKDTLVELMEAMQRDVGTDYKAIVYGLAEKHGVPLIISE